jgi:hypothetical protein
MTSSLVIRSYVFTAVLDIGLLKKNACSCKGTCIAVAGAKQGPTRGAYPGNLSSMLCQTSQAYLNGNENHRGTSADQRATQNLQPWDIYLG